MQVPDEKSLVYRAQNQDPAAFGQLYEAYFDKIYRYVAVRIGNETEAEDMAQQVFLNALKSISSFRWKGVSFSAWLFRIAHNLAVDHLRKKARFATVSIDELPLAGSEGDPPTMAEWSLEVENLTLAIKELTKAQQEVISLRFAGGLSVAQTSKVMGRTEGAVKALQHSAIAALRRRLVVEP